MTKMIFVNLPVRDLATSIGFYEALGANKNADFSNDDTASMMLSDSIGVMLLTHRRYGEFTSRPIGDARRESQALIALTCDSRATVDAIVDRAAAAGGRADPNAAQDHGFMYGRSVEDPDGYVWEIVWMDMGAASSSEPPQA